MMRSLPEMEKQGGRGIGGGEGGLGGEGGDGGLGGEGGRGEGGLGGEGRGVGGLGGEGLGRTVGEIVLLLLTTAMAMVLGLFTIKFLP